YIAGTDSSSVRAGRASRENVFRSDRPAEVPALGTVAADRAQPLRLDLGLDSVGGHYQTQAVPEGHQAGQDRLVGRVDRGGTQALDERAGELEPAYRQRLQVDQVGVAGTEVVDGQPDPELGQLVQGRQGLVVLVHDRALGDLQLELVGRQPRPFEH